MSEHVVQLPGDPHAFGLHLGLFALGDAARKLGESLSPGAHPLPHTEDDQDTEGRRRDPWRRNVQADPESDGECDDPGRPDRDPRPDPLTAHHRRNDREGESDIRRMIGAAEEQQVGSTRCRGDGDDRPGESAGRQ